MASTERSPRPARERPLRRALAPLVTVVLAVVAISFAQPNPILWTDGHDCREATLPLRVAILQSFGNAEVDPITWVAIDEFRAFNAALSSHPRAPTMHVVVLAYLAGDPVEVEVLLTPFGADEPTWRAVITPTIPTIQRGTRFFPYYLAVTLPRREFRDAFPVSGPYHLVARPARPVESASVHGFCSAETSTWVLVRR